MSKFYGRIILNIILLFLIQLMLSCGDPVDFKPDISLDNDYIPREFPINSSFEFKVSYTAAFKSDQTAKIHIVAVDAPETYIDDKKWFIKASESNSLSLTFTFSDDKYVIGKTYEVKAKSPWDSETPICDKTFCEFTIIPGAPGVIKIRNPIQEEYRPGPDVSFDDPYFMIDVILDMNTTLHGDDINVGAILSDDAGNEYEFNRVAYTQASLSSVSNLAIELEFGGTLPNDIFYDSEYQVYKSMIKMNLKAQVYIGMDPETSTLHAESQSQEINVRYFDSLMNPFPLDFNVEYDCHTDVDICDNAENEKRFLEIINSAFYPGNVDVMNIVYDNKNLSILNVSTDEYRYFASKNDVDNNGFYDSSPHVLIMGNLLNSDLTPNINFAGISNPDTWTDYFGDGTDLLRFSYVFMNTEITHPISTLIHELGHQFEELPHASGAGAKKEEHNSPFCIMNGGLYFAGDNDHDPGNDSYVPYRFFGQNPHFCLTCLNKLRTMTW